MAQSTLTELHLNKYGKISDKWSSYLAYYDFLFRPLRDAPIKIFEIGMQNGGSLETWSQYFKNAELIVGCDINEKCAALTYKDTHIKVVIGDANSQATCDKINSYGQFDIIIDDGSHASDDILLSFLNYFPHVKPGGIYVVEDTHAVYLSPGTGIKNKHNVLCFFKELTDLVNYQFWSKEQTIESLLSPCSRGLQAPEFLQDGWIESLEFRNSIVTIKKSLSGDHNKLGSREVCGNIAAVEPFMADMVKR